MEKDYGKCPYCQAPKVFNPKTGKTFCKDKCWLKKSANEPQPFTPDQAKNESIRDFQEKKQEGMTFMAVRRSAVDITVAEMGQGNLVWDEELIKQKLESWKNYFDKFYQDTPFEG